MGNICLGTAWRGRLLLLGSVALASACATERIRIETDLPADVSFVEWGDLAGSGQAAGKTPLDVRVNDIKGRVLRISRPGKIPLYWISSTTVGSAVVAKLKLTDMPLPTQDRSEALELNKVMKLVLSAYQALDRREFDMARDLAAKATQLSPFASVPHIVQGMALLGAGNNAEAKAAFLKAKALDAVDSDVEDLMKLVE